MSPRPRATGKPAHPVKARASPASAAAKGIVFLDFDNTLVDGDAGPLFGWYLFSWRRHELHGHAWRRAGLWLKYLPYITGMGLQLMFYKLGAVRRSSIIRASYRGLRGAASDQFYGLMQGFADEVIAKRIYPQMRDEVVRHLAAGRRCVVITTGIEGLVRHVLDRIDPRIELIGCRMRERKGKLTGVVDGPMYGLDKANILHAYARALGAELDDCWAYSDHWSDKHMLEAVGHPVGVNPRGRLKRVCVRNAWMVLEPRLTPASASAATSTPT